MTKILLITENIENANLLGNNLEENYLLETIKSNNFTHISEDYMHEAPDLVLLEFNSKYLMTEVETIREFDTTACIVAMISENNENLIPFAYKSGVRSIIKYYPEMDSKSLSRVVNQIASICNMAQRNGKCLLCWKETKFTDKYHEEKSLELSHISK